ncbi:MAG: hypothetical protein JWO57_1405 [Pseudonocardiales bacterium]|nr:hypothetical protein [Pseudonocardiales bacterium]
MWRKIAVAGAIAAATLGAGTAALATSGSTTSGSPAPASGSAAAAAHPKLGRLLANRAVHGTWVTRDAKTNSFVTHDAIRGTATAVSSTSITVNAADNTSQTYAVTSATKVRQRANKKGAPSSIGAVHTGDDVLVAGTGDSTLTATWIVDVKK